MSQTLTNKFRYKRKILFEELNERIAERVSRPEADRRSLPKVDLTEVEIEFLKGLVEGRSKYEIAAGLNFLGEKKSYNQILGTLLQKFHALNLPNAIYKAVKMGIID